MIIDTNVYLSRWPFRRVDGDEPANLMAKLRQRHVVQAWAGSFDGMLHRDTAGVNSGRRVRLGDMPNGSQLL